MNPPAALGHLSRLLLSHLDQRARLEVDELVMDSAYKAVAVYVLYIPHTHRIPQCTVNLKSIINGIFDFVLP